MMQRGKIYTQENIQTVWHQFALDPLSIVWSDDDGKTWNEIPSMDTGKWQLRTYKNGNPVYWIFKIDDTKLKVIVKQNYLEIDNKEVDARTVFDFEKGVKLQLKPNFLDLRVNSKFLEFKNLEIINRSGRNLYIIGKDSWKATLRTGQGIKASYGYMPYMSQYSVR